MTIQSKAVDGTKATGPRIDAASMVRSGFSRTLTALNGVMLGGATPRGYQREGYPEIELHQLMAGRRDRFEAR